MSLVPRGHPVIAGVLGVLVVGLGHVYLREWIRGLWWAGVVIFVGAVFVPSDVSLVGGSLPSLRAIAPMLGVVVLSTADAVVLAVLRPSSDGSGQTCPSCGQSADPELAFCQWCSAELPEQE